MVLPVEVTIKQEKEYFEYDAYETLNCDIEVKVEKIDDSQQSNGFITLETNSISFDHVKDSYSDVVDYHELTEYSLDICNFCNQMFTDSFTLLCHNLKHLTLKLTPITVQGHRCPYCLLQFQSQSHFKDHFNGNCQNDNLLVDRNLHLKKTQSLHQCHVCNKVFTYKVWHEHIRQVHGVAKFQCDLCNSKFKAKKYVRRHIMCHHEGLLQYRPKKKTENVKCDQCPAVFKHKTPLHLHVKNCHCEKVRCDKCFSVMKKSNLPNHIRRVHYNDGKVHRCDCGKTFRSPRYLKVHIKNSHSKKNK